MRLRGLDTGRARDRVRRELERNGEEGIAKAEDGGSECSEGMKMGDQNRIVNENVKEGRKEGREGKRERGEGEKERTKKRGREHSERSADDDNDGNDDDSCRSVCTISFSIRTPASLMERMAVGLTESRAQTPTHTRPPMPRSTQQ